ncbi:MAG: TolC family protein, partial [Deltaproteobacteria bacterium]|nr:TolC family protein [Deltaproteobacteria bacterium]
MGSFCPKRKLFVVLLGVVAAFCLTSPNAQAREAQKGLTIPGVSDGERLTLERCIDIALEQNPEIAAGEWDISAAESRLNVANAAFWPWLRVDGSFLHDVNDQRLIPARYNGEPGTFDDQILRSSVGAKMVLYSGGRISSEAGAAEKLSEAEKKKFIRTREELVYAVSASYYAILGQQKIIDSLEFSRQALEQHMKRVLELYEARKAARVDILRTEVRLTNLAQNILKQKNVLAVRERIVFSLMGFEEAPVNIQFDEKLAFAVSPVDTDHLVETALQRRPDYQAAVHRMEAQSFRVKAARAGYLPDISLVGAYGVKSAPSPEDRGRGAESTVDAGSVGIVLTIPLFEGGRVSAKVSQETATLEAVRERLRKLEIQIRQETETAVLDLHSDMARVNATQ